MAWKFKFEGDEYDLGTLTLDDYIAIEDKSGISYRFLTPVASAKAAKYIAAYMYSKRIDCNFEHALGKVGAMNADEYGDGLSFYLPDDAEPDAPPDPPPAGES